MIFKSIEEGGEVVRERKERVDGEDLAKKKEKMRYWQEFRERRGRA